MSVPIAHRVLLCRAGSWPCALPLGDVVEVTRPLGVRPVAGAPALVAGLATVRGEAVPVVDVAALLGVEARPETGGRWVVCRTAAGPVALAVGAVEGFADVPPEAWASYPRLLDRCAPAALAGLGHVDDALRVLVAAGRAVPEDAWASIR